MRTTPARSRCSPRSALSSRSCSSRCSGSSALIPAPPTARCSRMSQAQGRKLRPHRRRRSGKGQRPQAEKDGTVHVDFAIDKGLRLTEGTKAAVRYENLIGDRYLALEEGPGPPRRLPPGATIPLARTSPALDVDALIGGFRPLFRALDPDQVNALSGQLLRVFQGQGATISSVLARPPR